MVDVEAILVVGGGIGGLALGIALKERGFEVELVERSASWSTTGAGLSVQGNGMRVLAALGISDGVMRAGARLQRMSIAAPDGETSCAVDLDEIWGDVGPCVGIARASLHRELVARAVRVGLRHRLATTTTAIVRAPRATEVAFSDGSRHRFDLVVAADGISSDIRRQTVDGVTTEYLGQMVWRALVPMRPRTLDGVTFIAGSDRFFGMCPVGANETYVFGNVTTPRTHDDPAARAVRFREAFADFGGDVPALLSALAEGTAVHFSPVEHLTTITWGSPRIMLLGDAAHASSPMLGQGGSMALEDALVLAEELERQVALDDAFAAYVRRRTPRIEWVRAQGRAAGEAMALPAGVRDGVLRTRGADMLRARYAPLCAPP